MTSEKHCITNSSKEDQRLLIQFPEQNKPGKEEVLHRLSTCRRSGQDKVVEHCGFNTCLGCGAEYIE